VPYSVRAIRVPGKTVLPQKMSTQFRFITRLALDYVGSTGAASVVNLKANSLFDPLGASGATQPPFFDQIMSFYQRYEVTGCSLKMTVTNTQDAPVCVYMVPVTDITDTYTLATAAVMPNAKMRVLGSLNGSSSVLIFSNYAKTKNVVGVANTDDLQGASGADPTRIWYWHISSSPALAGLATDYTVAILCEMTFYTFLSDAQVVANS